MKRSYIFAITLVLLVGIQLYQSASAQNETGNQSSNNTPINSTEANNSQIISSLFKDGSIPIAFILVIFLMLVVPVVFDMYLAYRRSPKVGTGEEGEKMHGMPGLYRSLMSFGLILLIGTVIFYLLALITLNIDSKNTTALQSLIDLLKNLGIIIGTALATIIAFYFGVRGAESAAEKASTFVQKKEPPSILSTVPDGGAKGVKLDSLVQATFSESMNVQTINNERFTVKKQGEANPMKGKISFSSDNKTAMFDAEENFSPNTVYVANIDMAAQDLAGDQLVSGKQWSFTTGSTPPPVNDNKPTPPPVNDNKPTPPPVNDNKPTPSVHDKDVEHDSDK